MSETELAGLYVRLRKLRVALAKARRRDDDFAVDSLRDRIDDLKALLRAEVSTFEHVEEQVA